jgi:hypothetical protein
MPWTAQVINKQTVNGVVNITIQFTDGMNEVTETFRNPNPLANWIPDTVRDRMAQLEIAYAFDIGIGSIAPSANPIIDPNIELFRARCRALEIIDVLIRRGALTGMEAKVIALVDWIKNNANYLDYL